MNVRLEGGRLEEVSLFALLAGVQMARATGALVCTRGDTVKEVFFSEGRIVGSRSNREDELIARLLLRWRIIDEKTFVRYDEKGRRNASLRAGEHLIAWGVIDRITLEQALRQQILLRIGELFAWNGGEYMFSPGEVTAQLSPLSYADICNEGVGVRYGSRYLGVAAALLLDQKPRPVPGSPFETVVFDESEMLSLYDRITGRINFRGLLDPRIPERFWRLVFAMRELGCISFDVPEGINIAAEKAGGVAAPAPGKQEPAPEPAQDAFRPGVLAEEYDAVFRSGKQFLRARQFLEAELAFFKAAVLRPDNGLAVGSLAWSRVLQAPADKHALEQNLGLMEQACRLAPDDADIAFYHAGLLRLLGRNDAALGEFRRVLRLEPGHQEARLVVDSLARTSRGD